jgi:hypothetical protein
MVWSGTAVDLVLTDVHMRGSVDGLGLLRRIHKGVVAYSDPHCVRTAGRSDARECLHPKLYNLTQVVECIAYILDSRAAKKVLCYRRFPLACVLSTTRWSKNSLSSFCH